MLEGLYIKALKSLRMRTGVLLKRTVVSQERKLWRNEGGFLGLVLTGDNNNDGVVNDSLMIRDLELRDFRED